MFHVLGLLTLAADVLGAGWLTYYLIHVGSRPYSWQRKLPVPEAVYVFDYTGDDVAGLY